MEVLGTKVAVLPLEDSSKTSGGLHVPDQAKRRADQGVVVCVGPLVLELSEGDFVTFSSWDGNRVEIGDLGTLIIVDQDFVTAKLEKDEKFSMLVTVEQLKDMAERFVGRMRQSGKDYEEALDLYLHFVEGDLKARRHDHTTKADYGELRRRREAGE